MRVMAIHKDSTNITLDDTEVAVLLALFERVAGAPTNSYRKVTDSMKTKLLNVGISEDLETRVSMKAEFGNGVYFNDGY